MREDREIDTRINFLTFALIDIDFSKKKVVKICLYLKVIDSVSFNVVIVATSRFFIKKIFLYKIFIEIQIQIHLFSVCMLNYKCSRGICIFFYIGNTNISYNLKIYQSK